jgi:hypothetical protein
MISSRLPQILVLVSICALATPAISNAARIISLSTCESISAKGMIPEKITDHFTTDAPGIHAVLVLDQVKSGLEVKGNWISVDAIEIPDYQIDSTVVKLRDKETRVHLALSRPDNGWPVGNYRVDIYFDDNFITSAPFAIAQATSGEKSGKKPAASANVKKKTPGGLVGNWECATPYGISYLVVKSDKELIIDGERFAYTATGGVLKVRDDEGISDYPYSLENNALTIKFEEGYELTYLRTEKVPDYAGGEEPADNDESSYKESAAQSQPPASSDLMQHFAGTWWNATTNTETEVTLTADGRYIESSSSSYSGGSSDQYGNSDMNWGAASDNAAQGSWTARGNRERGELIITFQDGSQKVFPYQVHVENGEVYWSEYYFNGVLYGKK